jgi:hypothetical protein
MNMKPRIYTYKIVFDEIPDWYWGVHKEVKHGEEYFGSPVTHAWKWEFYTPRKQILEEFDFSEEGWQAAQTVEKRLILPDLHNPLCLNEGCGGLRSLRICKEGGRKGGLKTASIEGHMYKAGVASGKVWTEAKREASRQNAKKAHQSQKDRGIQIYGPGYEYFRRKGRLNRWGVKIDGKKVPAKMLSETFKEYHLLYGKCGKYDNPS